MSNRQDSHTVGSEGNLTFFCPCCLCFLLFKSEVFVAECILMVLGYEECKTTMAWYFSGTGCWQLLVVKTGSQPLMRTKLVFSLPLPLTCYAARAVVQKKRVSQQTKGTMSRIWALRCHPLLDPHQKPATSAAHEPLLLHCKKHRHSYEILWKEFAIIFMLPSSPMEVLRFRAEKTS